MIWGVGTGRCGTTTYAHLIGARHEPPPSIHMKQHIVYYYQLGAFRVSILDMLKGIHEHRRDNVDNGYSFVIPLIYEVDPMAEIHWLIREPKSCVNSMFRHGFFGLRKGKPSIIRVKPHEWPEGYDRLMQICWYWKETNERILKDARDPKIILTESLPRETVLGENALDIPMPEWEDKHIEYLKSELEPLWRKINDLSGSST